MPTEEHAVSAPPASWPRRLAYAFVGLLAGNVAMAAYMDIGLPRALFNPGFNHRLLDVLLGMLGSAVLFGTYSLIGWVLVGVPVVFLLPLRIVSRLPWSAIVAIAALLGPAAFLPIFLLFRDQTPAEILSPRSAGLYWILSVIASVAGFPTYCWLVRRRLRISAASPLPTPVSR